MAPVAVPTAWRRKGYCKLDFEYFALDGDPALRQEIRQRSRRYTVPQIWTDSVHVGGYRELLVWDAEGKLIAEDIARPMNAARQLENDELASINHMR